MARHMQAISDQHCTVCDKKYVKREAKEWRGCDHCSRWFCGKHWASVIVKHKDTEQKVTDLCSFAHVTQAGYAYRYIAGQRVDLSRIISHEISSQAWLKSAEIGVALQLISSDYPNLGGFKDPDAFNPSLNSYRKIFYPLLITRVYCYRSSQGTVQCGTSSPEHWFQALDDSVPLQRGGGSISGLHERDKLSPTSKAFCQGTVSRERCSQTPKCPATARGEGLWIVCNCFH